MIRSIILLLFCLNVNANEKTVDKIKLFTLEEATIGSIHDGILNKQINCATLVELYLTRIKKYDLNTANGAPLNAITYINLNAQQAARAADTFLEKNKKLIGNLHCIPIIIKDNINAYDMPASSGSLSMLGSQPIKDSFITEKLRNAGAIILASANMDEFASGLGGVSSRSGRTGNAYDTNRNSGGSSAGSAVAVSANFGLASIGSDNSGSLRIPAAYNGLYTLRPSTGLISQNGIFPRGNLDGVAGPMTRTVKDLAILLDVIAQPDPEDPKTQNIPRPISYTAFLNKEGLQGKRIGILREVANVNQFRGADKNTLELYNHAFKIMEQAGAVIIDNIKLSKFNNDRAHNMAGEVEDINRYLSVFPSTRKNYQDICTSGRTTIFGGAQGCLAHLKNNPSKSSSAYNNVLKIFADNKDYVEKIMDEYNLDALVVPVDAAGIAQEGIHAEGINCLVASNSGLPSIGIIAGYVQTPQPLPVGLELVGRQFAEPILLEMAYAFEQHTPARIPPQLKMPKKSSLENFNLAEINNIHTVIGNDTYEKILKNNKASSLTPNVFQKIVEDNL